MEARNYERRELLEARNQERMELQAMRNELRELATSMRQFMTFQQRASPLVQSMTSMDDRLRSDDYLIARGAGGFNLNEFDGGSGVGSGGGSGI